MRKGALSTMFVAEELWKIWHPYIFVMPGDVAVKLEERECVLEQLLVILWKC